MKVFTVEQDLKKPERITKNKNWVIVMESLSQQVIIICL
jgi:hypothetical protein